jgi:hypothetical protein
MSPGELIQDDDLCNLHEMQCKVHLKKYLLFGSTSKLAKIDDLLTKLFMLRNKLFEFYCRKRLPSF